MIYLLPLTISLILGLLIIKTALNNKVPGALLTFFLSGIIGLGSSAILTFSSFVIFNQLSAVWVIALHLGIITALGWYLKQKNQLCSLPLLKTLTWQDGAAFTILAAICIPTIIHASLYPYGGWDAWGTWNMKARFLFLGGTSWSNMFDPMLWRDQINYPFLLPLMHVWLWCFGSAPTPLVPLIMTCLITFLSAGVLFGILKEITGKFYMVLIPACLFTNLAVAIQASSQYSDLLVATFLLTALGLFALFNLTKNAGYLILMGATLGMMGFTKAEGMGLLAITGIASSILIMTTFKDICKNALIKLWSATIAAAIPLLLFVFIYAPRKVVVFKNGLTAPDHPLTWDRFSYFMSFMGHDLINNRWQGLWILPVIALMVAGRKSLNQTVRLFPVVLLANICFSLSMFYINTHYDIVWWMNTSFERVALDILPALFCWATLALFQE
ncbi:MAG: hypothetical protein HQL17_02360 [Candidatus Omnitrophica bacterium]|nr:hypothetical protein [Candidatus Omnitrophota bacterium]